MVKDMMDMNLSFYTSAGGNRKNIWMEAGEDFRGRVEVKDGESIGEAIDRAIKAHIGADKVWE